MAQQLKNPPAPVSKTVQRLLAQIHAEAQAATLEALSAKDGIVTLQDIDARTSKVRESYGGATLYHEDESGYQTRMTRQHVMPECWRGQSHMDGAWRPGQWLVTMNRLDGHGREWTCSLGAHITDDFGNLVCVEGGAA